MSPTPIARAIQQEIRIAKVVEAKGVQGDSAYAVALSNGFEGTQAEWLASLEGAPGDSHVPTPAGQPDGKALATLDGELVYVDPESGGGSGDMAAATYDPTGVAADAFDRANHAGTQPLSTISDAGSAAAADVGDFATAAQGALAVSATQPGDLGTAAALDVPTAGNATSGQVVKGGDARLSDARPPIAHTHVLANITDAGSAAAQDATAFATAAQGATADTAVQPGELGTAATTDATAYATAAQGTKADSATQPADLADVATSGAYGDLAGKPTIPSGVVESVVAGTNVTIDDTDPANPIVNASGGGGGAVDSVNGETGAVLLDADDISDAATAKRFTTPAEISKLAAIAAGADVTDQAKVITAGAVITVVHGATAATARPSGALAVYWRGTVEPINAADGDLWEGEL